MRLCHRQDDNFTGPRRNRRYNLYVESFNMVAYISTDTDES